MGANGSTPAVQIFWDPQEQKHHIAANSNFCRNAEFVLMLLKAAQVTIERQIAAHAQMAALNAMEAAAQEEKIRQALRQH